MSRGPRRLSSRLAIAALVGVLAEAALVAAPAVAAAEPVERASSGRGTGDDGRMAIQRPKFQLAHELTLSLGVMPLDAFQKGLTGSLSYTVHFSRWFAWELFQVSAAYLTSTSLRDELIDTFAISPDNFNAPRFMATTGLELSPVYGKQVFLNGGVVHQGAFFGLHGGVIFGDRPTLSETFSDLRPAVGLGLGYRLFLGKTVSTRIDVRDFLSFRRAITTREDATLENVLLISIALSLNFGRDDA